jgi:uncharacterized coiled-coil DUF342 family protein
MILVLTSGRYDEYHISGVYQLDEEHRPLVERYQELCNQLDRADWEMRQLHRSIGQQETRLATLKKEHKINETRSRIKKMQAEQEEFANQQAELRETVSATFQSIYEIAQKLDESEAVTLHII